MVKTYDRARVVPKTTYSVPNSLPTITADTKLVDIETACQRLKEEKGYSIVPNTIRRYCKSGKWEKGYHWVKPSQSYLINLEAVYAWLTQ